MTRPLAPLYLAAGMVAGLWGGQLAPVSGQSIGPSTLPPRGWAQEGGILSVAEGGGASVPVGSGASVTWGGTAKDSPGVARDDSGLAVSPLLAQLDAIDARIAALAYPDPRHCDDACLTGVERVELRRGVVSCRCRKLPSLGVHRLPEGP